MRPVTLLIIALALGWPLPAVAQDMPGCESAVSTVEMSECAADAYEQADAELNAVWKQALATIEPSEYLPADAATQWRDDLIAAQRAWVTFKEKDCDAVAFEWYGGTGAGLAVSACLYAHTVARTEDLKARFLDRLNRLRPTELRSPLSPKPPRGRVRPSPPACFSAVRGRTGQRR